MSNILSEIALSLHKYFLVVASTQKITANNNFEVFLSQTQVDKENVGDPARRLFRTLFKKSVTKDEVQVFDPLNMFKGT